MDAPRIIDKHVGEKIRVRRTYLGMSQALTSDALGVSIEELQKYEMGLCRVGASRLSDLSNVLEVPISFFFDDFPRKQEGIAPVIPHDFVNDEISDWPETLILVQAFQRVIDPRIRKRIIDLVKSVGLM